ncbi:hypothetical protein [Pseudomonas sp. SG20052]|uniref:hypothetical protein n=1 Tax=Pseudomonas sp. SG20052 TaxID=3074147 RepID=UPI00287FF0A8|nr:hypothetical protein [Pseudomonas sp. SG20052]WNF53162.1 hypothetical protein RHP74_17520 [Pseudomonas sp. SG20052]
MIGMVEGFPISDWIRARDVARDLLIQRARRPAAQTITYGDLVAQLPIAIEPDDPRLSKLLDEISRQEFAEGRGFLTVLVVHKRGDLMPGKGFFEMAADCGVAFTNRERFWTEAFNEVLWTWRATS